MQNDLRYLTENKRNKLKNLIYTMATNLSETFLIRWLSMRLEKKTDDNSSQFTKYNPRNNESGQIRSLDKLNCVHLMLLHTQVYSNLRLFEGTQTQQ